MEMLIKHYKVILKGMCGNKTLKAVERSTAAAYGLNKIIQNCDRPQDFSHFGADTFARHAEHVKNCAMRLLL